MDSLNIVWHETAHSILQHSPKTVPHHRTGCNTVSVFQVEIRQPASSPIL